MAKRKKCSTPDCLSCKWWPKVGRHMGVDQGCYWIDEETGEVFVATGLRALADGSLVDIRSNEGSEFYEVECNCGAEGFARGDLLEQGKTTRCPQCAAALATARRN